MFKRFRLLGVLVGATLAGCGQTGGLYLPDKDAEVVNPAAESSTTVTPVDPADDAEADRKREEQRQPAPQ